MTYPGSAAEDTGNPPHGHAADDVAEAPLQAIDLNAAMEGPGAQGAQHLVEHTPSARCADVVDMEYHWLWKRTTVRIPGRLNLPHTHRAHGSCTGSMRWAVDYDITPLSAYRCRRHPES